MVGRFWKIFSQFQKFWQQWKILFLRVSRGQSKQEITDITFCETRWHLVTIAALLKILMLTKVWSMKQLVRFDFSGSLIQWCETYLLDRSQFVAIGSGRSQRITRTSDVPQWSILWPLLFLLFVNDFDKNTRSA